jgi:hypothetical protein
MISCLMLVACLSTPTYASAPLSEHASTVQYRFHLVDPDFGLPNRPIEMGPDGNIWFGAEGSQRQAELGRLAPNGSIKYFPISGTTSIVVALGLGPNGTVTVGLFTGRNSAIGEMKTDGKPVFVYTAPSGVPVVGSSLSSDSNGNIFFGTNTGSQMAMARVSPAGHFKVFQCPLQACSSHFVQGVVRDSRGNFWFTYSYGSPEGAGRMTPDGTFKIFQLNGHYPPGPPALGSDGNIWFMDNYQGQYSEVVSITPGGSVTYNRVPSNFQYTTFGSIGVAPGKLWFDSALQLGSVTTQGIFLPFLIPPQPSSFNPFLGTIAIGSDGNVYVAQSQREIIEVILPTAQQTAKI